MAEEKSELLQLDLAERAVPIVSRDRKKIARHFFRRLTAKDVAEYFARRNGELRREKQNLSVEDGDAEAKLHLYRQAITRVEGYATADGSDPRDSKAWPENIRSDHRMAAIDALLSVSRAEAEDEFAALGEFIEVPLNAPWTEGRPGEIKVFRVVHRFRTPTDAQTFRCRRALNRKIVVGGSREGMTRTVTPFATLVALYDELIESVEGYAVAGQPLTGHEAIVREMDAYHKAESVLWLFPNPDAGAASVEQNAA